MHSRSWIGLLAALGAPFTALAITDGERLEVYREFRKYFDARQYPEALPVAEELVSLTEEQYGTDARALVSPLANLGTTHLRLGNHQQAETAYIRSVQIAETTAGSADRALVRPLHGLGATYYAVGQFEDASSILRRAVDLSRNVDGLFNVAQLQMLEPLIASYVALAHLAEAEQEHQYAFRIAENAFGRNDVRMLEPLDRFAKWYEFVGRYTTARVLHARALSIAEQNGRGTPASVPALRGIARTYRLEFLNGAEEVTEQTNDPYSASLGVPLPSDRANVMRLNPDGERALRLALTALEKAEPVDHAEHGRTLVEFGDWYMSGGATTRALETYREAWKELALAGSTQALEAPRLLAYRPPIASTTRSRLDPENADASSIELTFTVTREGRTADIRTIASDAPEATAKSVLTAVRKARYAPRLENGEPVDTQGIKLTERLLTRRDQGRR
jgi:tetratricopeptide (TPR) repeat protein